MQLEPYSFVKTIRYLLLIYVIPINDYVLEKRRMVFIYLPYSSGAVLYSSGAVRGHALRSLILQKNVRVDEQLYTEQYW